MYKSVLMMYEAPLPSSPCTSIHRTSRCLELVQRLSKVKSRLYFVYGHYDLFHTLMAILASTIADMEILSLEHDLQASSEAYNKHCCTCTCWYTHCRYIVATSTKTQKACINNQTNSYVQDKCTDLSSCKICKKCMQRQRRLTVPFRLSNTAALNEQQQQLRESS